MSLRRTLLFAVLACCLALAPCLAPASEYRSQSVKHEFQRQHPCPSTGRTTGACPGYVKDHVVPLCLRRTRLGREPAMAGKRPPQRRLRTGGSVGTAGARPAGDRGLLPPFWLPKNRETAGRSGSLSCRILMCDVTV